MVHCGYEPTAVTDVTAHPIKALRVFLKGIETEKPMVADIPLDNQRPAEFVFEGLVKTLSQKKAEEQSLEAERRAKSAGHAA